MTKTQINDNPLLLLVVNLMPARLAAAVRLSWERTPATLHSDLAQEAFTAYLDAKFRGLPEADRISAAENAMARLRRKRGPRRPNNPPAPTAAPKPQPKVDLLKIPAAPPGWANDALWVLPSKLRQVIDLKIILNCSYKVVANEMAVTPAVIRRLVAKAKPLLRLRIEELDSLHGILPDSIRARIIEQSSQ